MKSVIPDEVYKNHTGILGKTGSGKTVTAKLMAESLLEKSARICAIDPTGVWWGLKSKANGKSAAYPIVVFGGRHADMPLAAGHGSALAEIIGTTDLSCVLDTSLMTVGDRTRFFTDFAETLLRKNESPLHLFMDEAHVFAPQGKVPNPQSGMMLHAANNLVSLGRSQGLRIVLISQRPAKLHKDSLTQVETLIAMRLIAPQDRAAVSAWIGEWDAEGRGKEIINSLPSLATGEGWLWAPEADFLKKVKFPMIKTYDSSAAPKGGKSQQVVLANIDLPAIEEKLKKASVDVLADDPRTLKRQISDLQAKIKKAEAQQGGISEQELSRIQKEAHQDGYKKGWDDGYLDCRQNLIDIIGRQAPSKCPAPSTPTQTTKPIKRIASVVAEKHSAVDGESLSKCEQAIVNVLAQFPQGRTKNQIGLLSGYSSKSGGFNNALSKLRSKNIIEGFGTIELVSGAESLAIYDPLPSGQDLLDYWVGRLGKCEGAILSCLHGHYPNELDKENLGNETGYSHSSGGFNNSLSKLRTLELISRGVGIKISDNFFQ